MCYPLEGGAYTREHFFNTPELKKLVEHLSDEQIARLPRGGHDSRKVYAAYRCSTRTGTATCWRCRCPT
jgi:pyruvate dehydrogenase E1 component